MGLFGKKEVNRNGLFNKIANPNADPNSGGLLGRVGNFNNGKGLLGGLFNRNSNPTPTNQPTNFQENNNNNNNNGGSSW